MSAGIGDIVRLQCGATGRYIGRGYALWVGCQDNDLCVGKIAIDREPQLGLPLPTDGEVTAASVTLSHCQS